MKKLFVITCMMFSTLIIAQRDISAGGHLYLGTSTMDLTGIEASFIDLNPQLSYTLGGHLTIPVHDKFSFIPAINYNRSGFHLDEGTSLNVLGVSLPVGARLSFNMHFLQSPLLMEYKPLGSTSPFHLRAGVAPTYMAGATMDASARVLFEIPLSSVDLKNTGYVQDWQLDGILEAGADIPMGNGALSLDLRYIHALSNQVDLPINDLGLRRQGVMLGVGYSFRM